MNRIVSFGLLWSALVGESFEFSGQMTGMITGGNDPTIMTLRYLPKMNIAVNRFRLEAVPNLLLSTADQSPEIIRPYRIWTRYAFQKLQITAGLQKINFGPGKLLRSLQWFDQLDPRDPTQATQGVWGISSTYTTSNNQVFWLWSLYGNEGRKGLESLPGEVAVPEWGGRMEQLLGPFEIGATLHSRALAAETNTSPRETRIGLDAYCEPGPGLWFESSFSRFTGLSDGHETTLFYTIGADYTWPFGNGLYLAGERLRIASYSVTQTHAASLWAVIVNYPLSWLDTVSFLGFFRPADDFSMFYLQWQHKLDNWDILTGIFFSADSGVAYLPAGETVATGSAGLQILLTYNH